MCNAGRPRISDERVSMNHTVWDGRCTRETACYALYMPVIVQLRCAELESLKLEISKRRVAQNL